MARYRRLLAAAAATTVITGCALPQAVAPSRYGRVISEGQKTIPDEVVVTLEPGAPVPPDVEKTGPQTAIYKVKTGETLEIAVRKLQGTPGVSGASVNVVYKAAGEAIEPNDPIYSRQWYLSTIGASRAWAKAQGGQAITVAILDSGIDAGHPEFSGRIVGGQSFVPGSAGPNDDFGHGTHVAGAIGALTNNGVGIAGVAPHVKLLPIKVLDSQGLGTLDVVVAGIQAAKEAGVRVINMSLASQVSSSLQDQVIDQCVKAGIIVVAAAGNDGTDTPEFPAGSPGVLAIGATDMSDVRTSFSNGGAHVRIVAPGVDIASTYPRSQGSYVYKNGTSMAAPIVTGVVAAMLAVKPSLTPNDVARILYETGASSRGFSQARRVDFAAAIAAVVPEVMAEPVPAPTAPPAKLAPTPGPTAPPVAAPIVTPGPIAPKPTPSGAPAATPRPDGQLPAWGYVNYDGDTTAPPPPGTELPKEGLRTWGYVGYDEKISAAPDQNPPAAGGPDKPLRNWGYVPLQ